MIRQLFEGQLPQAVLFDLDGTLVDSAPDIAQAVNRMLVAEGFGEVAEQAVRGWVGNGAAKLVMRAMANALQVAEDAVPETHFQQAMRRFRQYYQQCCHDRSTLYPRVLETLQVLQQNGVKMACVTNKPLEFTTPLLDHLSLTGFFQEVLGGECLARKKPDPLPLLTVAERLVVPPQQCLMVGDSYNDIEAASAAGMPSVCVSYGYHGGRDIYQLGASRVIDQFAELLRAG